MKNQRLGLITFSSLNVSAIFFFVSLLLSSCMARNLYDDLRITWGNGRSDIVNNGHLLTTKLDKVSGSGFESKSQYLFVKMDMQIKLARGDSAGTVTTYYMSSKGKNHDEIDFEFLGNVSGDPYTVHTNVFCNGIGKREQQFRLWFNPSDDFHTYSIYWTPRHILFLVDGVTIREYKNLEKYGVCFPKTKAMKMHSSIWNADDWATRGGLVKTDWSKAPFTAYYKKFNAENGCVWNGVYSSCKSNSKLLPFNNNAWLWQKLDNKGRGKMKWVQNNFMVYNYCKDKKRFPLGFPKECYLNDTTDY